MSDLDRNKNTKVGNMSQKENHWGMPVIATTTV